MGAVVRGAVWLALAFLAAGCLPSSTAMEAAAPTPTDWDAALEGVVIRTGETPCMRIQVANVAGCAKDRRFNLYCVERGTGDFATDTPKGCGIFRTKTISTCGGVIEKGVKLKCRIDTDVPQATRSPTPAATPFDALAPCKDRNPAYCWHRDSSVFDNSCFSNCECVLRSAGPCHGTTPTARPTVAPPPPVATPAPTSPPSPLTPCVDGDPGYCWHKDSRLSGNNCFSNCACLKRPHSDCIGGGPSPSPVPTPRPTPPKQCPSGQHAEWICVDDAAPAPTPSKTPTPIATPPRASDSFIDGGWFINECTTNVPSGGRVKWYNFPYVFAAFPKGFNKHVADYGEACTPNQEVWTATVAIPYWWENSDATNIEKMRMAAQPVIVALRERRQLIENLRAQGVPESKLPKMPVLWVSEGSSGGYGYFQDLNSGGFFKTVNGKQTLKSPAELSPVLPPHIVFLIELYQAEGVTEFADAPYTFLWANELLRPEGLTVGERSRVDLRGRVLAIPTGRKALRAPLTGPQLGDILHRNNPALWPKDHVWRANPDNVLPGHASLDLPDEVTFRRDATYYLYYLYALRGQHPEITRVIPQLSNCVYNRRPDSPHWTIAASILQTNAIFGLPPDIQIEGCTSKASLDLGKPWDTPVADCRAKEAIEEYPGDTIVSMWLSDIRKGLLLDYSCR